MRAKPERKFAWDIHKHPQTSSLLSRKMDNPSKYNHHCSFVITTSLLSTTWLQIIIVNVLESLHVSSAAFLRHRTVAGFSGLGFSTGGGLGKH